jgi:hypothetical protein
LRRALTLAAAAGWIAACATSPKVPLAAIALHYDEGVRSGPARAAEREAPQMSSVGDAFDEAYELRERMGARRAEPLFQMALPRSQAPEMSRAREDEHDPRAEANPLWSLEQVAASRAWEIIRNETGRPPGEEASGIFIAHPDTGYRPHAEISTPVSPELGYDYMDEDDDPTDELLEGDVLDNPAHGTGSGSAIASPEGCQVPELSRCPTGPALGARLVPLRVGRSVVVLDTDRLSRAILDASGDDRSRVKAETQVMSISMGGLATWTLWDAVKKAEARGYLIVAAAGNYVRTVVWPARFPSVIAVAATNVGCRPWSGSSAGPAVDVSAPGESVWRASLTEDGADTTGMSKGTTYATATVAGVAALWLARHAGTPELDELRRRGELASAFQALLGQTAWKPGTISARVPCDEGALWDSSRYGAGILDAPALLEAPLAELSRPRMLAPASIEELPLWSSLYPEETSPLTPIEDYRRLFRLEDADDLEGVAIFEVEVLHHYATDEEVRAAIDAIVIDGARSDEAFERVREALRGRDLSTRLESAL